VGKAVRAERRAQRLTQSVVAAEADCNIKSLSQIENGHRPISAARLLLIGDRFRRLSGSGDEEQDH